MAMSSVRRGHITSKYVTAATVRENRWYAGNSVENGEKAVSSAPPGPARRALSVRTTRWAF